MDRATEGGAKTTSLTHTEVALSTAIVGSLVVGGARATEIYWDISPNLDSDDFQVPAHRIIFEAIATLAQAGLPLGVEGIARWLDLNRKAAADALGGAFPIVAALAAEGVISGSCVEYSRLLREARVHREIQDAGRRIATLPAGEADSVVAHANRILTDACAKFTVGKASITLGDAAFKAFEDIQRIRETPAGLQGPSTTIAQLDEILSGLRRSCVVVLAGRPAMGKTSLGLQMAESCETEGVVPVFSLEMPSASLGRRELARATGIDMKKLMHPKLLNDLELDEIVLAIGRFKNARMMEIMDDPKVGPHRMLSRLHALKRRHGKIGGILVDYIQLMQIEIEAGRFEESRNSELATISAMYREAAKEFECPLIALSQLNRNLEKRDDKRPMPSDLRDSGGLEQEADIIAFIYREWVYNKTADPTKAELIIAKNRDGELGTAHVHFEGRIQRWSDVQAPMTGSYGGFLAKPMVVDRFAGV